MASPWTIKVRTYGSSGAYTDLTPYIFFEGVKWSLNPVDASDAGRDQSGKMHRAYLGDWRRVDLTMKPLTAEEIQIVLNSTKGVWLDVVFTDLQTGASASRKMYRGATLAATHTLQRGTMQLWSGLIVELIEE